MSAFLRKYATGTGADLWIPIIKRAVVDFAVGADWTPAAGDVKISIDGGAAANIGTLPVALAMGNGAVWKFVVTNAELTGKSILVTVADAATKAVEDQAIVIETYGHASALHPFDLGTASTPQTGDNFARLGAPAGASVSADVAAVKVDTAAILVDTGTTLDGRIPAALVTGRMDASVGAMAANVVTAAAINAAALNGKGDWNIGKTGYALSAAAVQAIWDALTSALTTAGSIGKLLVDNINATISSRASQTSVDTIDDLLDTEVAAIKTDTAAILVDTGTDGVVVAAGSKTGYALSAAGVQAIWDALTSALTTAGSIGKKLADWVLGTDNKVILSNNAHTGAVVPTVTTLTGHTPQTGDSYARLGAPAGASVSADLATKATPAQVNTEVLDVLNVDTFAEPGQEAPPATTTLVKKIGYLYKAFRNRFTQTATEAKLYNDDAATVDQKATVSDNGTVFDRGEMGAGP